MKFNIGTFSIENIKGLKEVLDLKAPKESPNLTGIPTAPTATGEILEQIANIDYVKKAIEEAHMQGVTFKGTIDLVSFPPSSIAIGDLYIISEKGTYDGHECEPGDMIVCTKIESGVGYWDAIQTSVKGAVIGPESSVDGHIAIFTGTTGKEIIDGGKTIAELEASLRGTTKDDWDKVKTIHALDNKHSADVKAINEELDYIQDPTSVTNVANNAISKDKIDAIFNEE